MRRQKGAGFDQRRGVTRAGGTRVGVWWASAAAAALLLPVRRRGGVVRRRRDADVHIVQRRKNPRMRVPCGVQRDRRDHARPGVDGGDGRGG